MFCFKTSCILLRNENGNGGNSSNRNYPDSPEDEHISLVTVSNKDLPSKHHHLHVQVR